MSTTSAAPSAITELLDAARRGDAEARQELFAKLYRKLRQIAVSRLRGERPGHTLAPTDLVHEAYLKLCDHDLPCRDRADFCGLVSNAMRRILIDSARRRRAHKRDGGERVTLDEVLANQVLAGPDERDVYLLALDDALQRLSQADADLARVLELRFFGGFSVEETAEMLAVGTATVKRRFRLAKAWLHREIESEEGPCR